MTSSPTFSPAAETTTPPPTSGPAAPRPSPPGPTSPASPWLHNHAYRRASLSRSRFPSICRSQVDGAAAALIAAELDADRPIGVVELGLFGGGEIPIADDVEVGRDFVDDGTPLPLEIEPGRRPDLPIASQQPLALEQRQRQQPSEIFGVDP